MLWIILRIIISYLIGSIPTAYIFGRLLKGIDIRKHGSGNVGATNAFRVLGKEAAILVLAIDILKGFIAVFFLGNISLKTGIISDEVLRIILALSCISGHNWSIFLNLKGGKGIATTLGALLALSIKIASLRLILALLILIWCSIFFIIRIVSVASVITGIALPVLVILFKQSKGIVFFSILLSIFALIRHRSNIKRVWQGKEPRISFRNSKDT